MMTNELYVDDAIDAEELKWSELHMQEVQPKETLWLAQQLLEQTFFLVHNAAENHTFRKKLSILFYVLVYEISAAQAAADRSFKCESLNFFLPVFFFC